MRYCGKESRNHSEEGNTFNNWQQLCRTYRTALHTAVRCIKSLRYFKIKTVKILLQTLLWDITPIL